MQRPGGEGQACPSPHPLPTHTPFSTKTGSESSRSEEMPHSIPPPPPGHHSELRGDRSGAGVWAPHPAPAVGSTVQTEAPGGLRSASQERGACGLLKAGLYISFPASS